MKKPASINHKPNQTHMNTSTDAVKVVKLVLLGILCIVGVIFAFVAIKFQTVKGNQYGILETWTTGVSSNILQPKTHWFFPGFMNSVYIYDGASQVFVMNDKGNVEKGTGRDKDAYRVQSKEGQDMDISLNLRWRIDPLKLVSIHKTVREDIEEKIIRPVVMRVVKDEATRLTAIDAYSGEGLVRLQTSIQSSLTGAERGEGKELSERGIIVENFVIEHIKLDDKYIEEIKGKQIATQKTLRAVEEQKAAEAKALVAKSEAMAEYNTKLVAQQLLSTNMVIQAGAENERVIIAAKAQAEQVTIAAKAAAEQVMVAAKAQAAQVELAANAEKTKLELEGEGKKLAMVAVADGTLAMGKADAAAKQLLVESYKGAGQDAYVQIQVAQSLAEGTKSIQGYLPNNFNPTVISENFVNAIQSVLGGKVPSTVASK
jgi:regulator of protease activity HflC (stomatin/prohibitin superfamily)